MVELCQSRKQGVNKDDILFNGLLDELHQFRTKFLPANFLDYFLEEIGIVPKNYLRKSIYFIGTTYISAKRELCVRCLDCTDFRGPEWNYKPVSVPFCPDDWFAYVA